MLPQQAEQGREHVLLTVLGINQNLTTYSLGNRQATAAFAPIALLELLPEASRPKRILAICTPEAAAKTWPAFANEVDGRSEEWTRESIRVRSGIGESDINDFLQEVATAIPQNAVLTVDVTHGFRHYSFLTYVTVQYLTALHGVQVRGAYYGLYRQDLASPFLDLRPLLELPHWTHALQVLRDTGSALAIAKIIDSDRVRGAAQSPRRKIADSLSRFSQGYLSGLPLEIGRDSQILRDPQNLKPLKRFLKHQCIPLADDLIRQFEQTLEQFVSPQSPMGQGWKQHVGLSEEELKRQAGMIDALLDHGHTASALGLLNEWTVSWAILLQYGEESDDWLDYGRVRHKAAGALNAIRAIIDDPSLKHCLTNDQQAFGRFWNDLTDLRNGYHHHGMRPKPLVGDAKTDKQLCRVREYWSKTLRSCPSFRFSIGEATDQTLLVSPIGMRPGVLFSAIHACRDAEGEPDTCVILCSNETEGMIADALGHSNFTGAVVPLVFKDPFGGGRDEIDHLTKHVRERFIGVGKVLVNVTGGTTLMGLAAESLWNEARRLGCLGQRFGLIDRRSVEMQNADPYQFGEPFWLGDNDAH